MFSGIKMTQLSVTGEWVVKMKLDWPHADNH